MKPERIAVFRALQLGDLLVAVPAFRALRKLFPGAEITLISLSWAASFVQRFTCYIDRFVEFVGYPGLREVPYDMSRTEQFLAEQRAYNYDLVLQMHGSGHASNPLVLELGAAETVGFYETVPAGLSHEAPYPKWMHEIRRNLALVALLDDAQTSAEQDTRLEFPLCEGDLAEAEALLAHYTDKKGPVVAFHPGARPPARRWPVEYFATVADTLVERTGAQILLTGGRDEEQIIQDVISMMRTQALSLAGKTTLGGLAALLSRLDLFVSNDTGPAHVVCAVDCPSITLFGPADVQRWAPLDRRRHPIVRQPLACSPCGYVECPIDHRCLRWLHPDEVLHVAMRMLQKERTYSCNA